MIFTIISTIFKWSTFSKRIVSGKNFKTILSVIYPVDVTKVFEGFLVISYNLLRYQLKYLKKF